MARLHIFVDVQDGKTVSQFGVTRPDKIVFHNQHASDSLAVVIDGATPDRSPLCKGQQKVPSFDVPANDKKGFKICDDFQADTFKYTATIGGAAPEDPIVIIEKSGMIGVDLLFALAAGAAGGAIIATLVLRARQAKTQIKA